ncbi:ribosome biogenesis regulatory protein homolog [Condylostylus longicornis]|uniref:ribosome biogenesis regulatory protein homolog n=1 Tax=Condylostylus longicornis TaxID=2530218 RepID=UPI00244E4FCD|nr:ribosome biogenesis regulatory protein homolog [Condylostylus longicornis]
MDIVKEVLEKQQKELEKYKPVTVEKHLEVRNDLGMMLCTDPNDINAEQLKENKENFLQELTRDNVQLLLNEIWDLPTERIDECVVAKLPPSTTILPRLRKIPGPKVLTKWEKFAKEKGIKKRKKDKKIFDQELDKWVPTYGYRRAEAEKSKDWVLEVPQTADPMADMFQQKVDLRNEKVAKNEIQRMKNIVRAKKMDIPRSGYLGPEVASSKQLLTAASIAKASTASIGKFQEKLPKEKQARGIGIKELMPGLKRKTSHLREISEKEENLELIKSVLNKKPKLNVDAAISLQKKEAKEEREKEATEGGAKKKGKKGGSKKGKAGKSRQFKKPKGGRGQKVSGKKTAGRKRR